MRLSSLAPIALCLAGAWPTAPAQAQSGADERPAIAEGVVPDEATKQRILASLRAVYGDARVVDRVQVQDIPTPPNWGEYVANMIGPGIKRVNDGKLEVNGQSVRISGQVLNEAQRQQVLSELSVASNTSYTVTNSLKTGGSEQSVLDATLADRIIEFESGSARLTPRGMAILDEMVARMREMDDVKVQIVGHTDNVGQPQSNQALSQARAQAVRAYLVQHGIPGAGLTALGRGADEPVADNATAEGRARNRRIEFKVL
ncbi:OmpA family protein [Stenotrophomonas sp. MMGLT7]|uniref:OmpA family protein n=1 Tax=Stenotrophomonas sp. MMGLT7 TaxID=2901227 RepID=UPI001E425E42|nr:OmpA family protein [Stenotrophomonas sp. MMGLT7]MCD7098111.1 OmpA family protein [Stenotrophomonas sp. MMGLT7]